MLLPRPKYRQQNFYTSTLRSGSFLTAIMLACILAPALFAEDSRPPNILYINADDLGVMDVGYNEAAFRTPNIDSLAKRGMTFTNAYAPAANCAPSRACVLSGQWTPRHGVYTVGNSDRGKSQVRRLIPIKNTTHLAPEQLTMAEALKTAGYQTIHLGKYHVGRNPLEDGFDVNVGGDHNGSPNGGYYSPWNKSEMAKWDKTVQDPTHRVEVFTREATKFMRQHKDTPMFIHFAPYLVHSPLTPVPEFTAGYAQRGIDPRYGSMVQKLDEAVGQLVETLSELGLTESTLIIFSSDNGGIAAIHSQAPYRAGKGSYYEGGIREPMVACWPGKVRAGSECLDVVNTLDLFPTFVEVADVTLPSEKQLDGLSILPLLTETGSRQPATQYWHFPIYLQAYQGVKDDSRDPLFRTRPGSAMRDGKWKLHEYFEDDTLELYDLEADPGERKNLAEIEPKVTAKLHQKLVAWRQQVAAPVPTSPNPKFNAEVEESMIKRAMQKSK